MLVKILSRRSGIYLIFGSKEGNGCCLSLSKSVNNGCILMDSYGLLFNFVVFLL